MTEQDTTPNTEATQPTTPPAPTDTQPEQTGDDAKFTQADVDRIIGERLKRAEDNIQKKILEGLGVESVDDATKLIASERKRKEAEMSDLEKAQAEIQKAKEEADKARKEAQDVRNQMITEGRRAKLTDAIRNSGGSDVDDLYILIRATLADEFDTVFEDGKTDADDAKLKAFVKTVQSKHPKYFGNPGAGNPSVSNGVNPSSQDDTELKRLTRKFRNL